MLGNLREAIAHAGRVPDYLICGVAPADGLLSDAQRVVLLDGIARGMHIINGLHEFLNDDAEFVARFHREARSAASVDHPNAVTVTDQGSDDGIVFLVMEYVPGRPLRSLLNERGRLEPIEALGTMEPGPAPLGAAHTPRTRAPPGRWPSPWRW